MSDTRPVRISDIKIGKRHRSDNGDLSGLKLSIDDLGLLHPIGLNSEHSLIFGGRRLAACTELGWKTIPATIIESLDDAALALKAERDENKLREPMTVSDSVALGKELEAIEADAAEKRRNAKLLQNKGSTVVENFHNGDGEKTRDKVGDAVGMSGKQYEKAKAVVESGTPELIKAVDAGTVSVNAAAEVAKLPKAEQEKIVAKGPEAVKKVAAKARKKKQPKEETAPADKPTPTITPPAVDPDIEATGKPPTHDALGIPIQPQFAEVFAQVPEFKALVRALKKAQKFYHKLADGPAGAFLVKRSQFVNRGKTREEGRWRNSHFEELIKTIEDCTPAHTACPYAHNPKAPHDEGERPCAACRGKGWAPPLMLNQIPPAILAATKAAFGVEDAA